MLTLAPGPRRYDPGWWDDPLGPGDDDRWDNPGLHCGPVREDPR